MIEELHKTWNIQKTHIAGDEFTGYESVYDQLNYTKEDYDSDPENVTNNVFNVYRSVNLVPIIQSKDLLKQSEILLIPNITQFRAMF